MSSRNISGGRRAEDIARAYLARPTPSSAAGGAPITVPAGATTPLVSIPPGVATTQDFYRIDKAIIISATTQTYRDFLREAGYADLDRCAEIHIAKNILKVDQAARNAATVITAREQAAGRQAPNWNFGADGSYITNINQPNSRKLVEELGGKVLTTRLMYGLFIPYIKQAAGQNNADAKATLNEMTNTKAEWLEDLVLTKNKVRIGSKERSILLPNSNNYYNPSDINELGYPNAVSGKGEFYLWTANGDERAAIRSRGSELNLYLNGGPGRADVDLGVRAAKFFP